MRHAPLALACCLAGLVSGTPIATAGLSPAETAAGWRMLFDGETWEGWRSYRQDAPPAKGWAIEDGALRVMAGGGGGDIVTDEVFGDFELSLEFKVSHHANSGIIYRVDESQPYPWMTGPEFQILDDDRPEAENRLHSVGAVYDLYRPSADKPTKPSGEWNHARIRISDGVVKHFLNGAKVAQYDTHSEEWAAKIAGSKFRDMAGFGVQEKGRIALQDHGDDVWYRNIRVRDLDAPMPGEVAPLAVRAGSHQQFASNVNIDPAGVFTRPDDGRLVCAGTPKGYIRTVDTYDDFVLRLEWRFPEKGGNSGVLLRTVGPDTVWPDCVEAQLMSGNAGDFVNLSSGGMVTPRPERIFGRKSHHAENPVGEWNAYEIIAHGDEITLWVNGEKLNHATGCPTRAGTIALQSEGVPIEFRRIRLAPIGE
jgi:hypothetical protein